MEIFDLNPADPTRLHRKRHLDASQDRSRDDGLESDPTENSGDDSNAVKYNQPSSNNTTNSRTTSRSPSPENHHPASITSESSPSSPPPPLKASTPTIGKDEVLLKAQKTSEVESRKAKILKFLHEKFPRRIVHRMIKVSLAYATCVILCFINRIVATIGPAVFLCITGCLFTHPGRTMGAQIDATITSVAGVALAICWAIAGMAASVSFNRTYADDLGNHQVGVGINAAFLVVGIMFAQLLRMRFPKFNFFSLQFMIVQIFCNTKLINLTAMDYEGVLQFGIPLILGAGVSLFYNLALWRETAVDGLGKTSDFEIRYEIWVFHETDN